MNDVKSTAHAPVLTRRTLLRVLSVGTAITTVGGVGVLLQACSPRRQRTTSSNTSSSPATSNSPPFSPDVELKFVASQGETAILPGAATATWGYRGEVVKGEASALVNLTDSYLGPILQLRKGQKVRIHLQNELPEATTIHWHGLIVPPLMDGQPSEAVGAGQSYIYEFEVKNRAGTYWFHPHPHGTTASQVNHGLAGLLIVHDDEETALELPNGEFDLPLVLQDRTFDTLNQFVYTGSTTNDTGGGMGGMGNMDMTSMMGFLGETILVNGRPNFTLPVATRAYRLRLLNGSNSRIYKLAWSNGVALNVIATDGGLLEKPVQRPYITLAPGERVELWADFSQAQKGDEIMLRSLAYSGVEAGMMGGMMGTESSLPNGAAFDVLTVRVEREELETRTLPMQLSKMAGNRAEDAVNLASPRPFVLTMSNMQWLINGKQFEMDAIDKNEKVTFNSLEVWEFSNIQGGSAGMGMINDFMAHPMHIHGIQFQIIERQIDPNDAAGWQSVKEGFVDEGWKDTVLIMPGERVKILARFHDYAGRYLLHCHNLEHESMGMMRNYLIEG